MALGAPSRDRCRLKYAPNALFELNNVSAAMRSAAAARLATGLVALLNILPPLILEPGQRPSQEVKCLTCLPAVHISANLGDDLERRVGVDAVDAGKVNPRHLLQCFFNAAG